MQHSPEPWNLDNFAKLGCISDADDNPVLYQDDEQVLTQENAERIVACVNACRGISNKHLDTVGCFPFRNDVFDLPF